MRSPARETLAMLALALIGAVCIYVAAGCSDLEEAGGDIAGPIAEGTICQTGWLIDCGHVYECAEPADNPLGHVEICIEDDSHAEQFADIEALYGECKPTPRHEGLCSYCCGAGCGRGANAYNGTYCP